ncbi:MAG TPA: YncE family protein, partial [Methylotenera sp.]|nr:YncE family protein [Methylotenera sp.]
MKNLIFILLFIVCACAPKPNSMAYITNQGDNTVSVIDIQQNKVINTIKVDKAPVGVAISNKLKRVFISNVESNNISVIDSAINKVIESITLQGSPVGLAMAPDHNTLYVADWFSDSIIAINTADY